MTSGIVVSLCDRTGAMVLPWAKAGYECWCVDIQHSIRRPRVEGNVHFVWGDARSWCPPDGRQIAILFAFPPCTDVAVSGARDFATKGPALLSDALTLFNACRQAGSWSGCPWMIENPVGVLSTHVGKPNYTFDPCDFSAYCDDPEAEAYTKKTCLWTGGGFVLPKTKRVSPTLGSKMHLMPPSDDRADLRSVTPTGFARAVFEANSVISSAKEVA